MIIVMRQKVKTFFYVFKHGLFPQPDYYSKIPKTSFRFSLKYLISLVIVLNLLLVVFVTIKNNPTRIGRFIDSMRSGFQTYPADLVINIDKGRLFTSYNRPYFFWLNIEGKQKLILAIDEGATVDKINTYHSYFLLTNKEMVVKNDRLINQAFDTLPLTFFGNQSFDKRTSQQITQVFSSLKKNLLLYYLTIVALMIIFLPIFSFLTTFFYLLIIGLFIYLIFKIFFHKKIHYKKILQLAFHAVTLPLLIDYFLIILKPSIQTNLELKTNLPSPLAFLILLLIFVCAAVYEAYQNHQHKLGSISHHRSNRKHISHR